MPLVPERPAIALIRMVMLVVGEPLARPEIALIDTGGITIDRAHTGDDRPSRIEANILDQEIANDRGRSDNVALAPCRDCHQRGGDN